MSSVNAGRSETSFRSKVHIYKKRMSEIKSYLDPNPSEWGRFQSEFNQEINGIFRDLIVFEKSNLAEGMEEKVYKLKNLFVKRFRNDFVKGNYLKWSLGKPYGYAGDFKIIDDIYRNAPSSVGFERLYDNYFQMSVICNAVRNRKEDFKRFLLQLITKRPSKNFKILNLACGPCRDVSELLLHPVLNGRQITFHCLDSDQNALDYAAKLILHDPRVHFYNQNAVRIALKRDITEMMEDNYDCIYSMGLFDYLDTRVSVRLINNLSKLVKKGGKLIIADVRDKFSNPSIYFMEWVADWNLVYRDDDDFRDLFIKGGFFKGDLSFDYEQQGVIQYVLATKS